MPDIIPRPPSVGVGHDLCGGRERTGPHGDSGFHVQRGSLLSLLLRHLNREALGAGHADLTRGRRDYYQSIRRFEQWRKRRGLRNSDFGVRQYFLSAWYLVCQHSCINCIFLSHINDDCFAWAGPPFPYQLIAVAALAAVVSLSYLLHRRRPNHRLALLVR